MLALAHSRASTSSYLSSQFLVNSRSDLHATSRSSHSRLSSFSLLFSLSLLFSQYHIRFLFCTWSWSTWSAVSNRTSRAGGLRSTPSYHSVFIDGEGRLSSCGSAATEGEGEQEDEEEEFPGLIGHGEGVTWLNTPTRLPTVNAG